MKFLTSIIEKTWGNQKLDKLLSVFFLGTFICLGVCVSFAEAAETTSHDIYSNVSEPAIQASARWNALDFGVIVGDENIDNTKALQKALDYAGQAGGGVVELPSGRFRFDGVLSIPAGVTLQGTYRVPPTVTNKDERPTGTTLLTYANRGNYEGAPFITLKGDNSVLAGVVVIYPEWKQTDVPPVPYPPCVASKNSCNVGVIDCCLLNPYEGINFVLAHRHLVRNVTGYPSWRGLFVDECYDIGHIENIHFWPFGVIYKADDPYCEWVNINGVAFELARTDWHYVSNTFCFGYGRGYYFSDRGHGGTNGNFLGIGADSCRRAVLVEQAQKQGLLITNGEFVGRWTSEDSVCLEIGEDNEGAVILTNCSFWGPVETCVWSKTKKSRVVLNSCEFVNWDEVHSLSAKASAPAVRIDNGRATLSGNSFEQSGIHLCIGESAEFVTAVGNQAPGGFRVKGGARTKVMLDANELDPLSITPEGKEHYEITVGKSGDVRFLKGWYGPEKGGEETFRWSTAVSSLTLPLPENKEKFSVTIDLDVPNGALYAEDSPLRKEEGVYWGNKQLAQLVQGANHIVLELDSNDVVLNEDNEVVLTICCKAWKPKDLLEGSDDERELGVSCYKVLVKASSDVCEDRIFDANTGVWLKK